VPPSMSAFRPCWRSWSI